MGRVYTCLTVEHDLGLVLAATGNCLFATWTAFHVAGRAGAAAGVHRRAWLALAALVLGCGIWSTHFVAMLAFDPGLPAAYELPMTALSVVIAVAAGALGFTLLGSGGGPRRPARAGVALGLGVAAMHYAGMAALRLPAVAAWDPGLVALSVALGTGLATLACRVALATDRPIAPALVLTFAICSLHFTGMAAFEPVPTPLVVVPEPLFSRQVLAFGTAAAMLVAAAAATAGALLDLYLARRGLREAERLRTLAEATFEGLVIHDRGTILDANEAAARLAGTEREALIGRSLLDLIRRDGPAGKAEAVVTAATGEPARGEVDILRPDGSEVPVEILNRPLEREGHGRWVAALRDLSERREAEAKLLHLAHHDPLTGLPNRALLKDRLRQALAAASRSGLGAAVLCLDLDRFKAANDTYGHAFGDALLRHVAGVLLAAVREGDTVARVGGDEFVVVQVGLAQPEGAARLAERLVDALAADAVVDGTAVTAAASVGVAVFPDDDRDPDQLLAKADMALYRAKGEGPAAFRLFQPGIDLRLRQRRTLERELRDALAQGQLVVFYQPQADTSTGEITGFEALARWPHPERGMVPPAEFVPVAEESGLIRPLGAYVLRAACAEAAGSPAHLRVGVNLSAVQFAGGDLAGLVERTLRETGLPPGRLELEITESVLIRDTENALATLGRLKRLGVRIAMDDVGTGYSSLSYLHRFPFDRIKLDRPFVADLLEEPRSMSIMRAVVGLGASLEVGVVAEGVENPGQLATLRRESCREVQGFLIGRPMPAEAVIPYLAARGAGEVTGRDATATGPLLPPPPAKRAVPA